MTRRTKVRSLAALAIGVALVGLFWPRENRAAREALDELRGLIDVENEGAEVEPQEPGPREQMVGVRLCVAKLCLNDATAGLFAAPGGEAKVVHGRVRVLNKTDALIDRLGAMGVLEVVSRPTIGTLSGNTSYAMSSSLIAALPSKPGQVPGAVDVGCKTCIVPTVLKDGTLQVELEAELSWLADGPVTPATAANPAPPKISEASTGKITARLRSGETLVVAGLTMNGRGVKTLKAPLLSNLPGVGGWFSWTYDREVEEELIVLATPRVLPKQR